MVGKAPNGGTHHQWWVILQWQISKSRVDTAYHLESPDFKEQGPGQSAEQLTRESSLKGCRAQDHWRQSTEMTTTS